MKRRIFERFDPRAIDGDNDGLVQDATAFERPSRPRVSGSMRRTLPEGLLVPAERPSKRRGSRRDWRGSGWISGANDPGDELYDESRGPADPKKTTRLALGNTRSVSRSIPSSINERIQAAAAERAKYYEQFRDPETGILKFPKTKKSKKANKRTPMLLAIEKMSNGLRRDIDEDLTVSEIAEKYNLSEYLVRNELKKQNLKAIHAGTKRRLSKPQKPKKDRISEKTRVMRASLADDAKNGLSMPDLVKKYNMSSVTIYQELRKQNLKLRRANASKRGQLVGPRKKFAIMRAGIADDVKNGLTIDDIMNKYDVSREPVLENLKKQNLKPLYDRTQKRLNSFRRGNKKPNANMEAMRAGLADDAKNELSLDQVVEKYKVSLASVKNELRYQNLKLRRKGSSQRPTQGRERTKYDFMRAGLADDAENGLNIQDVAKKYDVHESSVRRELRRQGLKLRRVNTANRPTQQTERRGVSGSMSWGRFNPPKPQLRDISEDLGLDDDSDDVSYSKSPEKPETFNVSGISMRQWNEFSSDMMAYLQDALNDPKFEYGDTKTQSRERRRSLMRAIAAIKQANTKKNDDDTLSMDFTEEGIRRLRTVLRVLKEQEVESVRHIDALRDNLPNRKSRGSSKSAWPTRTLINTKTFIGAPRTVRLGDPDTFDNQTSAMIRSRELGCIGIRRYSTVNGGVAWMPCTNESDYRRRRGVGPQAARDRKRRENAIEERIARRVSKLMRSKSAQIGILGKIQKKNSNIEFHEIPSKILNGRRFVSNVIETVCHNEQ